MENNQSDVIASTRPSSRMNFVFTMAIVLLTVLSAMATDFGPEFEDVKLIKGVTVDLRYASEHNFLSTNLYGNLKTAYLHREAFLKLAKAAALLRDLKPSWSLLVFDALRPRSVQRRLWDKVKGTRQEGYVGNPRSGSVHNFGFAVDLGLADEKGHEVDMGTPFDSFQDLAQPRFEERFLSEGKLTSEQVEHRRLLRKVMTDSGFQILPNEWWHFDALPPSEVRTRYKIVE